VFTSKKPVNAGWNWVRFEKSIFFSGEKLEVGRLELEKRDQRQVI
jgi:hypothetical protein